MDFDRIKTFVESVDKLVTLSLGQRYEVERDVRLQLEMMKCEVEESNRPLYTLCVEDAQGIAEQDGAVLTEDELYTVKKGVESGLGDCWTEVMSTAVDEALSERRYAIRNKVTGYWWDGEQWDNVALGRDTFNHDDMMRKELPENGEWVLLEKDDE